MELNKKEDDHKAQKKRVGPGSEAPPGNDWHRREQKKPGGGYALPGLHTVCK